MKCFSGLSSKIPHRSVSEFLYKMGSANRNETPSVMLKSMIEPLNYLRNKKERILEDIRTSLWSTAVQVNGKSDLRFDACEKAEMGWGF